MTDLPAGPELDALIATKVMGITGGYIDPNEGYMRPIDLRMLPYQHFIPSTNDTHAMEVVYMMQSKGFSFILDNDGAMNDGNWPWSYQVQFGDFMGTDKKSMPLAICRAALRAMEADK